ELGEDGPRLAVIEAGKDVALSDRLALAAAQLDDALAHERGDLCPGLRLDDAAGIDDLCRLAPMRRDDPYLCGPGHEPDDGSRCHHKGKGEGERSARAEAQDPSAHRVSFGWSTCTDRRSV